MAKEFVLRMTIDDDVERKDIALALHRTGAHFERTKGEIEEGDSAPIRSPDGEIIGEWTIE
jgi:hypothetical protein